MTSAEAPSRLYIPQPFASKSGAALTAIEATSSANVNFEDGFPSAYSAPNGGKFVTRGEMNAIGNLASVNEYARACGGIVTFDPQLCTKIGGYPRGAVLEFLQDLNYNRVISLKENNKVDFRSLTDTDTYTTITNGSVDGENWAYLGNGAIAYRETLCEIGNIASTPRESHIPIGGFCAPRSGIPYFSGEFSFTGTEEEPPSGITRAFKVYLFEGTTDPSSLDGVNIASTPELPVTKTLIYDTFSNLGSAVLKALTAGKYYSLWVSITACGIESNNFALKLS